MTDPTPTRAEAVAHILGLRHMSGDDLHLPSAADFIERLVAENAALRERAEAAEAELSLVKEGSWYHSAVFHYSQAEEARRAEAAAWNDAIEAAALEAEWRIMPAFAASIRALRRAAPTEDRCAECDCQNGGTECTWIKSGPVATPTEGEA